MSGVRIIAIALAALIFCNTHLHAAAGGAAAAPIPGGGAGIPVAPWILMACPALIILAAFIHHQNRELTAQEAWLCGLPALFPSAAPPLQVKG
jgi:hypothetical protein